ncbi:glycoside hydrolase family 76 protein [Coleophoma crateriformis]|uniref:Glycoside hydrolase family 76 protein n=1 Tax=Coleophoma crateriformis TaxID=565419 RepID=A0A3D8QEM5_9HELO|nr:glycoside hydrolase family 76 protein [Coleophoma crateriformis]
MPTAQHFRTLHRMLLVVVLILLSYQVQASPNTTHPEDASSSAEKAADALESLMTWYNSTTGRWGNDSVVPWWLSGNALQATLDYMDKTGSREYMWDAKNTIAIQRAPLTWWPEGEGDFRADSTDDTGWWALANVKMYSLTGDEQYLTIAKEDEAYMYSYRDNGTCGGGILWDIPTKTYNNAISNELYLLLAISIHNSIPGDTYYLGQATREWNFFKNSGMINNASLVNDGLTETNNSCINNNGITWTYNQGVILGGLTELYKATGEYGFILTARSIADAVIASPLLTQNGILTETCESDGTCDSNGPAYKGIFVRYLSQLNGVLPNRPYSSFLSAQVVSMYNLDRNGTDFYGLHWAGPLDDVDIATQTSAVSLLTAVL